MKKKFLTLITVLNLSLLAITAFATNVYAGPGPEDPGFGDTRDIEPQGLHNPILDPTAGNNMPEARSGALFFKMINGTLQFMMLLAMIIVLINLIQAGMEWISSGGDSSKLENARKRITNAVIGIIVLSASVAIWTLVKQWLGYEISFEPLFPMQP